MTRTWESENISLLLADFWKKLTKKCLNVLRVCIIFYVTSSSKWNFSHRWTILYFTPWKMFKSVREIATLPPVNLKALLAVGKMAVRVTYLIIIMTMENNKRLKRIYHTWFSYMTVLCTPSSTMEQSHAIFSVSIPREDKIHFKNALKWFFI